MLTKTLAVIALACLLTACEGQAPVVDGNAAVSLDQPQERADCPNRDDTSTACR
jgi:outer membrane PBP1 activator LpoA protein